jgi:hypothetical protein
MNSQSTPYARQQAAEPVESSHPSTSQVTALILSWTAVGIPLAWGVAETLRKTLALFQ